MNTISTIDNSYEFIILTKKNNKYNAKIIYDKINEIPLPKDIKIIGINDKEKNFELEETKITFFKFCTECQLEDEKINTVIYSYVNLQLIIDKLNYNDPIMYMPNANKIIFLKDKNIEDLYNFDIHLEEKIIIKNNSFSEKTIKTKFEEQNNLIKEYTKKESNCCFPYKIISYNIKRYLDNIKDENLENNFYYIDSKTRSSLLNQITNFIQDKNKFIFPIVGPYGIGKTLTAIIFQKKLYLKGIKSIYINIKYYFKYHQWVDKLETLMNECFYLCSSEKEYIEYLKLLYQKNYNSIWLYLNDIYEKIKDNSNYLFIIDQYKKEYDVEDNIFNFPNIHILLLSSINDKDIKTDIISILKGDKPRLNYTYILELFENSSKLININKEVLQTKIPDEKKLLVNENNNNIILINNNHENDKLYALQDILGLFKFLPRYISLLLNKYDNIYDFLNNEYIKIFNLYKIFFKNTNTLSDFKDLTLNYLGQDHQNEFLGAKKFSEYLTSIPIKYVNYKEIQKCYYLSYAFPLCEEIFNYFNSYDTNKIIFIKDDEDGYNLFEKLLKITLRCCNKLGIDGYFEVDTIQNLKLNERYKKLNNTYFINKSNILINQMIRNGKDYDFSLYMPNIKALILVQVKYVIKSKEVLEYDYYLKNYDNVKLKFENKFKVKIEKVYLLYFSSYNYNINRKKKVFKILKDKKINCLFFNVITEEISFDFINNINKIELNDSFILFPKKQKYVPQYEDIEEKPLKINKIYKLLNKKTYRNRKLKIYEECEIKKYQIEERYYSKFLNYFTEKKIISNNILSRLGKFISVYNNSFGTSESIPNIDVYLFIFEQTINDIDFNNKLGLVYVDDDEEISFLDIKMKCTLTESEFVQKFFKCSFAVGKYKKII